MTDPVVEWIALSIEDASDPGHESSGDRDRLYREARERMTRDQIAETLDRLERWSEYKRATWPEHAH